ncbi:MAG: nuclear transport factor 2 family protein, partial [Aquaticitalea sp.]
QDFLDNSVFLGQLGLLSNPENVGIIDSLYKAFAASDIPTVLGGMDANIVWNEAEGNSYADGNPYIGPDAVLKGVFARIGADNEYFKLVDIELHDMSNNQVLATLRYDGKFKESGKAYNVQVAHLWTLKDGKVIAFQQYLDTKKLADAEEK